MKTIAINDYNDNELSIEENGTVIGTRGSDEEILSGVMWEYVPITRFVHGERWASGGVNTAGLMKNGIQSRGIAIAHDRKRFDIHY